MRAIAFDTETGGLDWFEPAQRAFLITWADADTEYHALTGALVGKLDFQIPARYRRETQRFVEAVVALERGDRIWGHNLKFDLHHVREAIGFDVLEWAEAHGIELWDTHSLDQVLNPEGQRKGRGGHGLKDLDVTYGPGLAKQYDARLDELAKELGISLKTTPQAYWLIYQAFPEEMLTYARYDARATYNLGENHLLPRLMSEPWPQARQVAELERA